jgi:hypothetical protein
MLLIVGVLWTMLWKSEICARQGPRPEPGQVVYRTGSRRAGFRDVNEGERPFSWRGDLAGQANYAADVTESALDSLAQLPRDV